MHKMWNVAVQCPSHLRLPVVFCEMCLKKLSERVTQSGGALQKCFILCSGELERLHSYRTQQPEDLADQCNHALCQKLRTWSASHASAHALSRADLRTLMSSFLNVQPCFVHPRGCELLVECAS